jgi:heavy metal response regulator
MRLLIIEDDRGASRFIKQGLTEQGYAADTVFDGEEGLFMAVNCTYDLIILDVMLPEMNGFEVLKNLRRYGSTVPVIMLTARDDKESIVHGLELGADDYLVKPFAFAELLARIKAVVRRGGAEQEMSSLTVGNLVLDRISRTARRGTETITLSSKEFSLLEYLMRNAGQILTRTMILEHVWGYDFDPTSNVIDVHIARLRSKIDPPSEPKLIHTIKGVGYVIKAAT